jgi:DNA end-binding protein Ku
MSARPIGTATVSFGLVSVPVKMYSAAEPKSKVSFNWVHRDCGSRLKQQYVCKKDGDMVEREDMVKGYEFAKDQYVIFTPDELKALEEKASESVDIAEFVPAEQVERRYLSKIYYLGPDKGGERAYRLLSKALRETGLSAVARYAARGKQYLVLIRPMGDGLAMEQLHYADELRSFDEVPIGEGTVKDEELQLAVQLIGQAASEEFRPEDYGDDVRKRMMERRGDHFGPGRGASDSDRRPDGGAEGEPGQEGSPADGQAGQAHSQEQEDGLQAPQGELTDPPLPPSGMIVFEVGRTAGGRLTHR